MIPLAMDMERYRSEFPITKRFCFFNHAAVSPSSLRVAQAVRALLDEFTYEGISCYPKWKDRIQDVRRLAARLIRADEGEIAFIGNTSSGLSAVATGLTWNKGDVVLVPEPDFPANIYPWMNLTRHGVKVKFVKRREGRLDVGDVDAALEPGARLLSVSSVDFTTGFRCDLISLGRFCREKGLLFCVDAIQSLGAVPLDVRQCGIHFLAAAGHKWLLGPMGCGILYVDGEARPLLHPQGVGWKSVVEEEDFFTIRFDLKPDARVFEPGTMNVAGIYALGAALDLLLEVGVDSIWGRIKAITDILLRGLQKRGLRVVSPLEEEVRSGILSFIPGRDPEGLFKRLMKGDVMVSLRNDLIRLSPHFYNNEEDCDRFFGVLDASQD